MSFSFFVAWFIVFFLILAAVAYLVMFLRTRRQSTKALIGLIAMSTISIAALVSLVIAQVHSIEFLKPDNGGFLLLAALFAVQLIPQWTLPDKPLNHSQRISRNVLTGFAVVYAVFVLVDLVFHL